MQVAVMFRVYQEDLMDCSEDKMSFSDPLLVHFSTGATQVYSYHHNSHKQETTLH